MQVPTVLPMHTQKKMMIISARNGVAVIDIGAYEAETGSRNAFFYLPMVIR
jgi:hypothetical protein